MTAAAAGCADVAAAAVSMHKHSPSISPQHPSRMSMLDNHSYNSDMYTRNCNAAMLSTQTVEMETSNPARATRQRKQSVASSSAVDDEDDDTDTQSVNSSRCSKMGKFKKQNHSEIEKRRRDKMNTYILELSTMIPMCGAMTRKLDKLTVLRMAVQHLHSVRGALSACPLTARPRTSLLSDSELNTLILKTAHDCFLFVISCDGGRLLYVSASVNKTLQCSQEELLGQSLFDILHPKDIAKAKEQISASDLNPRERLIDIKTMLPVKAGVTPDASRFSHGVRRSFFCRIKCKVPPVPAKDKGEPPSKMRKKQPSEKKFCVVQFTGYLKSWVPEDMGCSSSAIEVDDDGDPITRSCLVAIGRVVNPLQPTHSTPSAIPLRRQQYVSRHATDGKFLYVDQRVTFALGYLPQELFGTSMYEYVRGQDLSVIARTHKCSLLSWNAMHTPPYSFRRKDGSMVRLQTHFKPLRNPWTKDVECLVAMNTVVTDDATAEYDPAYEMFKKQADEDMQQLIDSQVESHKIGSAIAEEVLRQSTPEFTTDPLPEVFTHQASSLVDNILGVDFVGFNPTRDNDPMISIGGDSPVMGELIEGGATPPLPLAIDGNGEAAMAVIMNFLEADAGLGGPLASMPWCDH